MVSGCRRSQRGPEGRDWEDQGLRAWNREVQAAECPVTLTQVSTGLLGAWEAPTGQEAGAGGSA